MIDAPPPPQTTVQPEPESRGPSQDMLEQFRELKRHELEKGAILGRFVILSHLDQGGMGAVYSAYDPELDRKVAIKLLLPVQERDAVAAQARLLREAQAMARLDDPNVVAIHDVGTFEDQIWLAMEYVDGVTLRKWLDKPRRWPDVLRVMLAVGRGLAAAHEKGLVHRDIKPTNIMISAGDRARVMDFGLACAAVAPLALPASSADVAGPTREVNIMAAPVTRTGTVLGTAGYMAPEQLDGKPVDARADQFAFCVTLWEALYGERPFVGSTLAELAGTIRRGKPRPPPAGSGVPSWLHRAMLRAFLPDPESRYESMPVLLDILERGRTRARVRLASAVLAGAATLAVGAWTFQRWDIAQRIAACQAEGASIAEVWNDDAKARLRAGLLASGAANAAVTADKVTPYFHAQAAAWKDARTEACLDTRVRALWDTSTYDQSIWCLDERRMEFAALIAELSQASVDSVQNAVFAAARLSQTAPCRDSDRLARLPALPHDRERVRTVQNTLSQVGALAAAGEYLQGLELAAQALATAEPLDWPPLTAAARWQQGVLLEKSGKYAEAERALEAAYFQAVGAGAFEVAAEATASLTLTVGNREARHDEGIRWSMHGDIVLAALGAGDDTLRRGLALDSLASVHYAKGEYVEAKRLYERSLAIDEAVLGPDHPSVATALNNLALTNQDLGAIDVAKTQYEQALRLYESTLGPDHPHVAQAINNIATILYAQGAYDDARALFETALSMRERTLGPEHPDIAQTLNNLALVHASAGAYETAKAQLERARAIWERALGPEHPELASVLGNLADVLYGMGRFEEAKDVCERALYIEEKTLEPDHPAIGGTLHNLASVLDSLGHDEAALALHERSLAIFEKALGPDHPNVATALHNFAQAHYRVGDYHAAIPLFERAITIREKSAGMDHIQAASSLNALANVRLLTGAHAEARTLFERSLALCETAPAPVPMTETVALTGIARIFLAMGRPLDALEPAERAVTIGEAGNIPPERLAMSRFVLAKALSQAPSGQGRDRERALTLARQAEEMLRKARHNDKDLAEVEAFLARRRSPLNTVTRSLP